jgi:methylated-DNA-[protein]-cysteine S-methyltransferase
MKKVEQADGGELRVYRRLTRALRALPGATAPSGLDQRVLARVAAEDGVEAAAPDVRFGWLESDIGRIYVAYGARGIRFIAPAQDAEAFVRAYTKRFGSRPVADKEPPNRLLRDVARALDGDCQAAKRLPLDLESLGSFERAVLAKALEIPRGEVRTYGWVAREIGRPNASRAVGRALGRNPIPFIIPCHRVVGSSGSLTGYGFGLPLKRQVLAREGLEAAELETAERRGERFRGARTTHIFCFPTCRNARRIQPSNVVPFRSESEAVAAGYRPCRVCRPAEAQAAV